MTAARALSWFELVTGGLLLLLATWLFLDLRGAGPDVDRHGYLALGAFAGLILAIALLVGGSTLRLRSRWRWLGQLPLVSIVAATILLK